MILSEPQKTHIQNRYGSEKLYPGFANHATKVCAVVAIGDTDVAQYKRFTLQRDWVVTNVRYWIGAVQSGTICMGIYDEDFQRLVTTGSYDCPAEGLQNKAFGPIKLEKEKIYFTGYSTSTGLSEISIGVLGGGLHGSSAFSAKGLKHVYLLASADSHPLPADASGIVEAEVAPSPYLVFT